MSIYDKSSLVLIPSGTKTGKIFSQKPVSGDGDFTFTRASAATRVNADGNIEKETGNLILQSNQFDTTWTTSETLTSGQSGYDGTNDAWKLTAANSFPNINQSVSKSGVQTFSVYAKAGEVSFIRLLIITGNNPDFRFDLSNGTIASEAGSDKIKGSITSVGNGWYRCEVAFNGSGTSYRFYPMAGATTFASIGQGIYIQDAQVERGLVARDVLTTTTTAVYGGITDNVPRLDYTDSSCPALLLEPLRTNFIPHSEYFSDWVLDGNGDGQSVTANYAISPEGVQNAYRLQLSFINGTYSRIRKSVTDSYSGAGVFSVYLKTNDGSTKTISMRWAGSGAISKTITSEWQRFDVSGTAIYTLGQDHELFIGSAEGDSNVVDLSIYGAQQEAGSYPTSYIPTYGGSSVSRVKDSCVKTGVSSLIGQTEGTLFVDVKFSKHISEISDGTSTNRIVLYTDGSGYVRNLIRASSVTTSNIQTNTTIQAGDKIALAYSNNDSVIYKNGVQIGSDTSVTIPATSKVNIGSDYAGNAPDTNTLNQTLLFKTRLSNEELATLTTI